jgi:hypothetical protein
MNTSGRVAQVLILKEIDCTRISQEQEIDEERRARPKGQPQQDRLLAAGIDTTPSKQLLGKPPKIIALLGMQ